MDDDRELEMSKRERRCGGTKLCAPRMSLVIARLLERFGSLLLQAARVASFTQPQPGSAVFPTGKRVSGAELMFPGH